MENYICVHLFQPEMATFGNPYWKWIWMALESEKRQFNRSSVSYESAPVEECLDVDVQRFPIYSLAPTPVLHHILFLKVL